MVAPRSTARRRAGLAATVAAGLLAGLSPPSGAAAAGPTLPLGDPDLVESRTTQTLAPGVSLTRIVRGTEPAAPDQIDTTTRGPWEVNVLRIDPDVAAGGLRAMYGDDLAQTQPTTEMIQAAGALAGVNASFFAIGATWAPGDPTGLGVYAGRMLSEPVGTSSEADLVVNAATNKVLLGRMGWSGVLHNRRTAANLRLEQLDHEPTVPATCSTLVDQTQCSADGDLVLFDVRFSRSTPSGAGVEVVLDGNGCVLRRSRARGTTLTGLQTAVQATGSDTIALLRLTRRGCLDRRLRLTDESGRSLSMGPSTFAVSGRYQLTRNGAIVAPTGSGGFFGRNPRTIAGRTADGTLMLVTIDGRQSTSVGATLAEEAAVARSLGMTASVNLDGGGSTTMATRRGLVNQPSDAAGERPVADALVFVPGP